MSYRDRKAREMAFFIQSQSMQPGGLSAMAEDLVKLNPARCRESQDSEACKLRLFAFIGESNEGGGWPKSLEGRTVILLSEYLAELALNPELNLSKIACPFFDHLGDALADYKRAFEAGIMRDFTLTSAGKTITETLDVALSMSRMVVIEGNAGSGKSTNARAWCAARPGRARYVTLTGITNRTIFFQKIGAALGFATCQRKAQELQSKVEDFFARSKMMLVLDEAHYAWPQRLRVETAPELIDWIDTALVNQGVPVALLCTDQFAKLKNRVERQTGWTSEQFMHRVFRYQQLPAPTREDADAVTRALLSCAWNEEVDAWTPATRACSDTTVEAVAGYAMEQRIPLACVASCVDDARLHARKGGRTVVSARDVWSALEGGQMPSDAALARAFKPAVAEGRARRSVAPAPAAKPSKTYVSIRRDEIETPIRALVPAEHA